MNRRWETWFHHERAVLVAGLAGVMVVTAYACSDDASSVDATTAGSSGSTTNGSSGASSGTTATGGAGGAGGASAGTAGTAGSAGTTVDVSTCVSDASTAANTAAVVSSVQSLVATLTTEQQTTLHYDKTLVNAQQWSNFPAGVVKRNGVRIGDMSAEAQAATVALVQVAAGETGKDLFAGIRAADDAYAAINGGQSTLFGNGNYYVSVHGTPSTSASWMLQVAGHHFVYNFTYNGHCTSATPLFDGAQPAIWTDSNGQKQDPIAPQRQAMAALFASAGATAQLDGTFSDMINGPGSLGGGNPMGGGPMGGGPMGGGGSGGTSGGPGGAGSGGQAGSGGGGPGGTSSGGNGDTKYPSGLVYPTGTTGRGVNVGTLSAEQKALVKTAIEAWVKNVADPISSSLLSSYESDEALAQTYVGYAGAADLTTDLSYGRIDGPRVWIEFTVQQGTTGTQQGHYHTIWRDKAADYGADYVSQ